MPKAVQIFRFGDPDVLEIVDVATPTPGPGEVRIRVRTTGLNPADIKLRSGARPQLPLPAGLGSDLAGTIDACGPATPAVRRRPRGRRHRADARPRPSTRSPTSAD